MYWLQLVVIVALLAAVGWLAIGGGGHMSEPVPDRPDLALPGTGQLGRGDVDRVRFSVGVRGYRMDEVDDVLDRLAQEIEAREQRIAQLEGRAPVPDASLERATEGEEPAERGGGESVAEGTEAGTEPAAGTQTAETSDHAADGETEV
jgi:DivIVA domain-containing protein